MRCGSVLFAGLVWLAGLTPVAGQSLIDLDPSPAPTVSPSRQLTVFVSRSLPDSELRALFTTAAGRRDVRIVFRGIRPGERLNDAIHDLHALLRGIESPPTVELDPPAFRAAGVTAVPVLLLQERGQTVARVQGTLALDWFEREVAAGRHGDLGTYGPVREIAEPDLLEELQRRVATLDCGTGSGTRRRPATGSAPLSSNCRRRQRTAAIASISASPSAMILRRPMAGSWLVPASALILYSSCPSLSA